MISLTGPSENFLIMTLAEYYDELGIPFCSSLDEIKKAYRIKARMYHPDKNSEPGAKDKFIKATEAYEFLVANYEHIAFDEAGFNKAIDEWRKYRQDRSRYRADMYARSSYVNFKNSRFYRSTRILNGTSIVFSFGIAVMVLVYTISGYIIRIKDPYQEEGFHPLFSFIMLLTLSAILFTVSFINLLDYIRQAKKRKRRKP